MNLPESQMIYEVTYTYNYSGTVCPRHEHLTESAKNNVAEWVANGVKHGGCYADLVVVQELGLMDISNLDTWLKIGQKNHWIAEATDPPFTYASFTECKTVDYLIEKLGLRGWCLGQAFYYRNLCFINQIDGGSEWRVIRDGISFDSWSCARVIQENRAQFIDTLKRMLAATDEQLKKWEYMEAGPTSLCVHCSRKLYPGSSTIHKVDEEDTCEYCWIDKKFYIDALVNKVKAGKRLSTLDIKPIRYHDMFSACGVDGSLIYWDENIAIRTSSLFDYNRIIVQNLVEGKWLIVDEYQVQEECLAVR
ncbi:hypothetical protein [Paenibacillus sp. FSL L8-0709]|uniref:hypothetical protein n=1 Tax=Paenibacillus sp. FSL L8-0709 TaxID=2975312 RepID=UPI0030F8373C